MSDTCIVCLGDLNNGSAEVPALSPILAKSPSQNGDEQQLASATDAFPPTISSTTSNEKDTSLIAHLQPCGHDLHNECLTPWVERANSCPICRRTFHLVQLSKEVGGDIISSYPVEDRTQVAELDPSMFLEVPDEEDDDQPCQACGEDDNEDVLMYCDGCEKLWHTYCVDLQEVPYGHWFCDNCRAQRDVNPRGNQRSAGSSRRRTRGQQRRRRGRQSTTIDSSWTQVWQSVWDRINLDLDFPYDDDETSATYMRRHYQRNRANRQAHDAWRRRMQVAEMHGAGGRFRDTEPGLASESRPNGHVAPRGRKSPAPQTESAEETMAWNAFDQARATDTEATNIRKKKRKSSSSSPTEPSTASTNGVIKRRRLSDPNARASSGVTLGASRLRPTSPESSPISRRPLVAIDAAGPSFLQSLLQEVEESSTSHNLPLYRPSPRNAGSPAAEQYSPRPSSPALSPQPSNHSSPRAMSATPPPLTVPRPSSPTGLSSSIQPVFPSTEYSPSRSSPEPADPPPQHNLSDSSATNSRFKLAHPKPKSRIPRMIQSSPEQSQVRSSNTSPTRATMSLSAKSHVQKLVSAALKPHYNDQTISKDEYTIINRDISRMLYDKIGDYDNLGVEGKAKWEKVAGEEVNKAVGALKAQAITVATGS